jgi:hypothetical protein
LVLLRMRHRVFLLSPANAGGPRARMVLNEVATFNLADRLRTTGAPIGDIFQFISGLYFRGKLAYSQAFAAAPPDVSASLVITAGLGLVPPDRLVTIDQLRAIAAIPIDVAEERYRLPLERDSRLLDEAIGPDCDIVLLGSVASDKYVEPLLKIFGARLLFPSDFTGRGDMSRGGLMLRSAQAGTELPYVPVEGATVRGKRPPKLPKIRR